MGGNNHHSIPEDELTSDCEPNAHLAVRSFLHPSFGTNAHPCASENVKLLLSRFKYQPMYSTNGKRRKDRSGKIEAKLGRGSNEHETKM